MRVALVGRYPRDPAVLRGGVEAVVLRLASGLARTPGVEAVDVVVSEAGRPLGIERPEPDLPLAVHSIGGSARLGNVLLQLPDRRRIAAALRDLAPDVVHAHSAHREALGALESGLPTVVTIHGILEAEIGLERSLAKRFRNVFRRRVVRESLRRMTDVILLSPVVAEHYRDALAHARTWVIENPVADRFFAMEAPESPDTLLFAGLLIPRKGIPNLLDAVERARREVPGIRLRLAGLESHAEHADALRRDVARRGLGGHVAFLGGLSPDALTGELGRCCAFVLVSKQETLPVAIQEAMACGKPVIASPVGGVPTLVADGETGFLVPHGDPEALADRIVRLLSDPALRARLGGAARRVARERFTLDSVCRRTLAVYRDVIARRGERRAP